MIIYKYPKIQIKDSKIILLIGYNPEEFINSFINVYSDINYEDKFRYKIEASNSNDSYKLYNIKARSTNYDLKIISVKSSLKTIDFIKDLINIFYKEKIINFINCIFITLEEKKHLNKIGIISFLLLMILFKYENLKDRINIIYSSKNSLDKNINENQEKNIILNEYFNNPAMFKTYSPKYFFINNNILFETNKENEWKKLTEEIKKIQNKIAKCIRLNTNILDKNKAEILYDFFYNNKIIELKIDKYNKNEQISFINLLINCNSNNNITSNIILYLYNKIIENKKEKKISDKEIIFIKDKNLENFLYICSNLLFTDIRQINCEKCDLSDQSLFMISKLFSPNLIYLNLSKNKFSDIVIFNEKENLINLKELNLSYNNITKIQSLINCKFLNLENLNLSHNEIDDISCLENTKYFNKLQKLDLSFNKIKKLDKINIIKTLNYLNLLNNEISEGILDFIGYNNIKLVLTKKNNEVSFKYFKENNENKNDLDTPFIQLLYKVNNDNINSTLQIISFKGIKILELYEFNDLGFLTNESLSELKILDIKSNIYDINVFNNIKFINIKEIKFNNVINKGFSSLNKFKSIKISKIEITEINSEYYYCNLNSEYPKINNTFAFYDLNFLKEQFLSNTNIIIIDEKIKNKTNIISYNEVINSFPIFKNLEAEEVTIKNDNNKFICNIKFYNHKYGNFRLSFSFDNLIFFHINFLII